MQNHKTYPMFSDIFLKINIAINFGKKYRNKHFAKENHKMSTFSDNYIKKLT